MEVDRVQERRRAAALARDYRDQESLPIAEIARRLERSGHDQGMPVRPDGGEGRAVKARYVGVCRGCAAYT